ncbi:MAG TPA: MFS transporter [Candidatus Methylomirabilis sp.]|nr:MFS transporter [Candidatus Methylomirabilis sp.]
MTPRSGSAVDLDSCYVLTARPLWLISIQVLDGIGVAIFGVASLLVIADLTEGTGRFNLAQGAIGAAVGIGASLSNAVAGTIVHWYGFSAGFSSLAVVAAAATALLFVGLPETRPSARPAVPRDVDGSPTSVGLERLAEHAP